MSVWIGSMKSNNPSMISRGEFGIRAVPRILDMMRRHNIASTFFVPGHTALAFPDLVKQIADEGHEIAHHGWVHENPADFDEAGERLNLERGFEALDKAAGVRPVGYRSPAADFSGNTVDLLIENGFLYDSSCGAHDFYPYYLRSGDSWSSAGPYVFGETKDLVEIPFTWGLDDFPQFEFIMGTISGLSAPSAVEEIWRGDFDYAYENCAGGVYDLTMHPQVIGRGHRLLMLERLIEHFKSHDGVVFETMTSYALRWKDDNPLAQWKAQNPRHLGPAA
jgi:peptidoglycan/xylan/chitin deacetylase (PgdA/CDA1 family)